MNHSEQKCSEQKSSQEVTKNNFPGRCSELWYRLFKPADFPLKKKKVSIFGCSNNIRIYNCNFTEFIKKITLGVFAVYFNTNMNMCASLDEKQTWSCLNLAQMIFIYDLKKTLNMELIELVY